MLRLNISRKISDMLSQAIDGQPSELELEEIEEEFDKGTLMTSTQCARVSVWLLRIAASDGQEHPHLEEVIAKLSKRIACYDGPGNRSGAVLSKEVRDKMAAAKVGRPRKAFTDETKAKMKLAKSGANNPNFGHKFSDATKTLLSQLSLEREARRRAARTPGNIIQMPPPEFSRGQMGKAQRALKRLGVPEPTEEEKLKVCRYLRDIGIDPMQASSRTLAKIYHDRPRRAEDQP